MKKIILSNYLALAGTLLATGVLTSCTFLPSSGPSFQRIKSSADDGKGHGNYVLITLNRKSVGDLGNCAASRSDLDGLSAGMTDLHPQSAAIKRLLRQGSPESLHLPAKQTVAEGDVLNVVIYDNGGGLFASGATLPDGSKPLGAIPQPLPPQFVDASGQISVPFAGRITVRGKSLAEIQTDIEQKLKSKTIDPQVIVTLGQRTGGDRVSVSGDVKSPILVPVAMAGTRLLDAIAAAGGSTGKEYETIISVTRESRTRSSTLREIFDDPRKNILLQVGDSIIVRVRAQSYLSFGANGKVARIAFDDDHLTLAEALANSGGPQDQRADPSGIFIYRNESSRVVRALGYTPVDSSAATCQVIYRLDLTQADGLFVARDFVVRDDDMLYIANSSSVGVMKFLNLVNAITAPARSGLATAAGVDTL